MPTPRWRAAATTRRGHRAAAQLPKRLPALRFGVGIDEVRERLDLGEIELAVLERAARELAGLRQPEAVQSANGREHGRNDRAPAVELQLGGVLASLAARSWETRAPAPGR